MPCCNVTTQDEFIQPQKTHAVDKAQLHSIFINIEVRVMFFGTFPADAVTEHYVRMCFDIIFNLIPISFVIAYFFTEAAYWQQTAKNFDFIQCLFQCFIFTSTDQTFFLIQYLPDLVGKILHHHWFHQKTLNPLCCGIFFVDPFTEPGTDDYRDIGSDGSQFFCKLHAV